MNYESPEYIAERIKNAKATMTIIKIGIVIAAIGYLVILCAFIYYVATGGDATHPTTSSLSEQLLANVLVLLYPIAFGYQVSALILGFRMIWRNPVGCFVVFTVMFIVVIILVAAFVGLVSLPFKTISAILTLRKYRDYEISNSP